MVFAGKLPQRVGRANLLTLRQCLVVRTASPTRESAAGHRPQILPQLRLMDRVLLHQLLGQQRVVCG